MGYQSDTQNVQIETAFYQVVSFSKKHQSLIYSN